MSPLNRPLKKLGEIAHVFAGGPAPQGDSFFENGKYPFIRTGDLGKYKITFNLTEVGDYINDECLRTNNLVKVKKGTIIFPKSGASVLTNNRGMLGIDGYLVSHLAAIDSKNEITNKYIFYFLLDFDFEEICENIAYPSLKLSDIKDLEIPLPPLATQKLIVAKLDETFAQIDEAIATTQANIDQTDELTKSLLDKVFEEGGYEKRSLNEMVQINSGVGLPSIFKDSNGNGEIPFYKVGQMNNDKKHMKNSPYFFTLEKSKEYKIKIFPKGSVLIPKRGAAIFTNKKRILLEDASYDSNIMGLKAKKNLLSDEFLYIFLNNLDLGNYVDNAGIPQINNKHIEQMKIPLPTLPKQAEIVSYLDHVFAQSSQLKEQYQKKLVGLKELKASVLQSAFEGKLV